jgi:hypothetical protein
VSTVLSALAVADRGANPAARFTALGRWAAAGTLVVGATFQVVAFALIPDFDHTVDRLEWIAAHPARADVSKTFDLLAVPFLLAGVIVYVLLTRERTPRLAWASGVVLGLGMCGLMAAQGWETLEFALVTDGRFPLAPLGDVADGASTAPAAAMGVLFIVGAVVGIVLTALALWRSRVVPRGVPILLIVFIVTDVALSQPLIAHVIALVGALWVASTILGSRDDAAAAR